MPNYNLYGHLPEHIYTLENFNERAEDLSNYAQDAETDGPDAAWHHTSNFVNFVLTGEDLMRGTQAVLHPARDSFPDDRELTAMRDYDSLIGFSPNILVNSAVYVQPVSRKEDSLHTSIHLKCCVRRGDQVSGLKSDYT